jgi:hypothetical protein
MGVSHVAVQFPLYEQLKIWAGELSRSVFAEYQATLVTALLAFEPTFSAEKTP